MLDKLEAQVERIENRHNLEANNQSSGDALMNKQFQSILSFKPHSINEQMGEEYASQKKLQPDLKASHSKPNNSKSRSQTPKKINKTKNLQSNKTIAQENSHATNLQVKAH